MVNILALLPKRFRFVLDINYDEKCGFIYSVRIYSRDPFCDSREYVLAVITEEEYLFLKRWLDYENS